MRTPFKWLAGMLVFLALWAVVVTIQHGSRDEVARIEAETASQSAQIGQAAIEEHTEEQKPKEKLTDLVVKTLDNNRLSVDSLLRDYEQNEIAADQHYKGKRLHLINLIPARIDKIGRDIRGEPYVIFRSRFSSHSSRSVQAFFTSESAVAPLRVGDLVTFFDGICEGLMLNVILEDSHISDTIMRPVP